MLIHIVSKKRVYFMVAKLPNIDRIKSDKKDKIIKALEHTDKLVKEFLHLQPVDVYLNKSVTIAGEAGYNEYGRAFIRLSQYFIEDTPFEFTDNTIRHEIAHLLTPGDGHGEKWKEAAINCGIKPVRCHDTVLKTRMKYELECPHCHEKSYRMRKTIRSSMLYCLKCYKDDNIKKVKWLIVRDNPILKGKK